MSHAEPDLHRVDKRKPTKLQCGCCHHVFVAGTCQEDHDKLALPVEGWPSSPMCVRNFLCVQDCGKPDTRPAKSDE